MNSRKSKRRALSRQMLNRVWMRSVPLRNPTGTKAPDGTIASFIDENAKPDRPLTEREQDAVIQHDVDKLRREPR